VLLKDGDIAAFTIYFEDFIHLMMVDVNLHRERIGSQLLAHCEKQISGNGYATIRLETFEPNLQAVNFYKKNGWRITGAQKEEGMDVNRVFLEKEALHK
jgi:ribosomal protein S18 acetylase RimI-like enzyme